MVVSNHRMAKDTDMARMTPEDAAEMMRGLGALIRALEDEARAVTPEEKAAAGLRREVEVTYMWADIRERNRQRILAQLRAGDI
jgi:hypothetical protein